MPAETKLLLALMQVENILSLIQDNEYEQFFTHHLISISFELQRQLTNLSHSSKIKNVV